MLILVTASLGLSGVLLTSRKQLLAQKLTVKLQILTEVLESKIIPCFKDSFETKTLQQFPFFGFFSVQINVT